MCPGGLGVLKARAFLIEAVNLIALTTIGATDEVELLAGTKCRNTLIGSWYADVFAREGEFLAGEYPLASPLLALCWNSDNVRRVACKH